MLLLYHAHTEPRRAGKRVIIVDTDPQCNLTGMALTNESEDREERLQAI
ncbi:hypothetical protein [Microcystis panniformis]|uniref:Regulatory protein CII n=1 Tax=Microcystis panniformis FACHB-1757 TaxID=1638788 RepID=A0A0K1S6K9_9CHRO|nr:hypothetical protein [Microcystis panniformis]AKV69648.1 regulatory protein CII [Microcystis panniformis FACHB-1757]